MDTTQARRQPQPVQYDVGDDDALYEARIPSSARRDRPISQDILDDPPSQKGTLIARRRSSLSPGGVASNAVAPSRTNNGHREKQFPLVPLLVGMVITILLVMTMSAVGSWWHAYQDDLHYGRPRTSQLDAVVGHGDSVEHPTHFLFINLNRHVLIIEIPGGDASHTRIFTGPILFGDGQELTPVTGEVRDVNGDGKPDLILHIQDQQIVLLNDGTTFHSQ